MAKRRKKIIVIISLVAALVAFVLLVVGLNIRNGVGRHRTQPQSLGMAIHRSSIVVEFEEYQVSPLSSPEIMKRNEVHDPIQLVAIVPSRSWKKEVSTLLYAGKLPTQLKSNKITKSFIVISGSTKIFDSTVLLTQNNPLFFSEEEFTTELQDQLAKHKVFKYN